MTEAKNYLQEGKVIDALDLLDKAAYLFAEAGDLGNLIACLQNTGILVFQVGETDKAIKLFTQALKLAKKIHNDDLTQTLTRNLEIVIQSAPPKMTFFQKLSKK